MKDAKNYSLKEVSETMKKNLRGYAEENQSTISRISGIYLSDTCIAI